MSQWVESGKSLFSGCISLNIEKDGDKTFIVRPKTELEEGEYCFFYIGKDIETTAVYDFTIIK